VTTAALPLHTVKPASARLESIVALLACVLIGAGCFAYAASKAKDHPEPKLMQWQISALGGLNPVDQAIHSSLLAAADEIAQTYLFTDSWEDVSDLEEGLVPPFYKDGLWEQQGRIQWKRYAPPSSDSAGGVYYVGTHGGNKGQGAYLLVMAHVHAGIATSQQNTVWMHPNNNPPVPDVVKPEALIIQGWRQVIAYSGADEAQKVRGS